MFRNHDMELQVETQNLLLTLPTMCMQAIGVIDYHIWAIQMAYLQETLNFQHKFCIMCMGCHHRKSLVCLHSSPINHLL